MRALLAVSILGAFMLALGKSFSWLKYVAGIAHQKLKGEPNLSPEEVVEFLELNQNIRVTYLNPGSVDVFNARLFDKDAGVELTYTSYWEPGFGKTEIIHVRWDGKRGMQFTLTEGQMTEFQRAGTMSPQRELYDHDARTLGTCAALLRKHLVSPSPLIFHT